MIVPGFYVLISERTRFWRTVGIFELGKGGGGSGGGNVEEKGVFRRETPAGAGKGCPQLV